MPIIDCCMFLFHLIFRSVNLKAYALSLPEEFLTENNAFAIIISNNGYKPALNIIFNTSSNNKNLGIMMHTSSTNPPWKNWNPSTKDQASAPGSQAIEIPILEAKEQFVICLSYPKSAPLKETIESITCNRKGIRHNGGIVSIVDNMQALLPSIYQQIFNYITITAILLFMYHIFIKYHQTILNFIQGLF